FMKPGSALVIKNRPFYYPDFSNDVHHEIEIVVRINKVGKAIDPEFAKRYYNEIALGVDFTARDLQAECKKNGLPWEIAKGFDYSAPISKFVPLNRYGYIDNIDFRLDINGENVQKGNSRDMIFHVNELIAYVSRFMTLKTGDLMFTGTPAGVGPVKVGDRLEGYIGEDKLLDFEVK
ncbi:MAG TPA: fumarylacetoacetate hydrolase family protein, partial [Bacteroidales bacterium]|nr:fumarylacetoacetate hydrolase family protein [Bacteroidales bacterium]